MRNITLSILFIITGIINGISQDTFSIVAMDPITGEVGSAGASCVDLDANNLPRAVNFSLSASKTFLLPSRRTIELSLSNCFINSFNVIVVSFTITAIVSVSMCKNSIYL